MTRVLVLLVLTATVFGQSQPTGAARIKGTLVYFFNSNVGKRPDIGSKIWIVSGEVAPESEGEKFRGEFDARLWDQEFVYFFKHNPNTTLKMPTAQEMLKMNKRDRDKFMAELPTKVDEANKDPNTAVVIPVRRYKKLYQAIADGNGNYVIEGVKPGTYTLIVQSANKHATSPPRSNVVFKNLTVQAGDVLDVSHDFGDD